MQLASKLAGVEAEEVSHSVDLEILEQEKATPHMGEAVRVSEEEEENKALVCKLLIKLFNFRDLQPVNNKKTMKKHFNKHSRLTENWIYPQYS